MRITQAPVREIQLDPHGHAAWIECPANIVPQPGQYLLAWDMADETAPLATPVFLSQVRTPGFLTAPPVPVGWQPGSLLRLQGPAGRGFELPAWAHRLALVALGETGARLQPLIAPALAQNAAVALFANDFISGLPPEVEIHALADLAEGLAWADFLCLDIPIERLATLRQVPAFKAGPSALPCPAQALLLTHIVCAGMAECGVCAVPLPRGWKFACQDGPVFNLRELDW